MHFSCHFNLILEKKPDSYQIFKYLKTKCCLKYIFGLVFFWGGLEGKNVFNLFKLNRYTFV